MNFQTLISSLTPEQIQMRPDVRVRLIDSGGLQGRRPGLVGKIIGIRDDESGRKLLLQFAGYEKATNWRKPISQHSIEHCVLASPDEPIFKFTKKDQGEIK